MPMMEKLVATSEDKEAMSFERNNIIGNQRC
jgi:hypothetical protein